MPSMISNQHSPNSTEDNKPIPDSQDEIPTLLKPPRRRWQWFVLLYLAAILVVGALAFTQGRKVNLNNQEDQVAQFLQEQFDLGLQDIEAGRYELARQRFEAIIRYDQEFPDAQKKLIDIYVVLNMPTEAPTPEPTSTPDPSPPEELFEQAKTALADEDWDTAITKLLTLRGKDPSYRSVEVDGMMYIALRYRGIALIIQGLMEEGLYDLSLAERFGPLDRDADIRRSTAQQYLLANSYIGLDWIKAAELFKPLCYQRVTNDSCIKYAEAAWIYGEYLWNSNEFCAAHVQFAESMLAWPNEVLAPEATEAAIVCATLSAPPPTKVKPTATETPTGGPPPTETPTPTP
jgi:tetratricopeptide (TPR) repeat protein